MTFFIAISTERNKRREPVNTPGFFANNADQELYSVTRDVRNAKTFSSFEEANSTAKRFNIKCYAVLSSSV